ncbi:MAG: MFS transporter [Salibacteraceae bacterium]
MLKKNDPKTIRAWAFYDWANSVYNLVITTAIFPIFFASVTTLNTAAPGDVAYVDFFGFQLINTELYSYTLSLSFLIVAVLSPFLSGIADYSGSKKRFLQFFCYLGATSCAMLYFFNVEYLEISMLFVLTASVGFWGSLVFYNAFLPEIADVENHDKVSARGFALGYIGSAILLISILIVLTVFGNHLVRYSFIAVGLWWAGFAQITYRALPNNIYKRKKDKGYIWKGFQELRKVASQLKELMNIRRFLRSFFVYNMGVQTIMVMAVLFAKKEIDWQGQGDSGLIVSVLIIQFVAIAGAFLFSRMSGRFGNIPVLATALIIWIGVAMAAYVIETPIQFYILAGVVGLVMGGIQSLSRSTYSKLLPETKDHASFFSFYDVIEKVGIVIGTFTFGIIEGLTSSMRNSALVLTVFFILGLILILMVKREKSIGPTARL